MKVKINRIHFEEVSNIAKIIEAERAVFVYRKSGYPRILKANCSKSGLLLRMVNVGATSKQIEEIRDR